MSERASGAIVEPPANAGKLCEHRKPYPRYLPALADAKAAALSGRHLLVYLCPACKCWHLEDVTQRKETNESLQGGGDWDSGRKT